MSHVKFVILSLSRTGSNHLTSVFNQSDAIFVHDEIFHESIWKTMSEESEELRDIRPRFVRAIVYADAVLSDCPPGKTHVGFKMRRDQAPEACHHLLQDPDVHKIILDRANLLATYSSLSKANATDVWHLAEEDESAKEYAEQLIEDFDAQDFFDHVKLRRKTFKYYRENSRGPTLDISYAGFVAGADHARSMEFLGLPLPPSQASVYRQLNSSDILSRFAEPARDEVMAAITELGHPEWAEPEL
jgi:hypothetical protein